MALNGTRKRALTSAQALAREARICHLGYPRDDPQGQSRYKFELVLCGDPRHRRKDHRFGIWDGLGTTRVINNCPREAALL